MTTPRQFKAAMLQTTSTREVAGNVDMASAMVREAKAGGADMVFMPENISMMEQGRKNVLGKAMVEEEHTALSAFRDLAAELGLWLHCGSLAVLQPDGRAANRTYVVDDKGDIRAFYDKIHMFDVDLPGGERYRESSTFAPGARAVTVQLPWGYLGLSVCYDLRFPHLYRDLAKAGAEILTIPAAFTQQTGEAHWHVLQRARAIETGCWVLSPAQSGVHEDGRKTFGHALAIEPWGGVVADGERQPGIVYVDVDLSKVDKARASIAALQHDREYEMVKC